MLDRLERALVAGELARLCAELVAEGHTIAETYGLLYGTLQQSLRAAGRVDDVDKLLAACESVRHALGATFEPQLAARIDRHLPGHLQPTTLGELVVELHDREGWSTGQIYEALHGYTFALDAAGRDHDRERVEDELDLLYNRRWPDEPMD